MCRNNPVNRIDPDGRADRRLAPGETPGPEHRGSSVGTTSVSVKRTGNTSRIVAQKNEHYGEVEKSPSKVSLDVSGEMRGDSKLLADVQVNVKADFGDVTTTVDSYDAVAGGFGNGAPENGEYTVDNYRARGKTGSESGFNKDGVSFTYDLNPEFDTGRTLLRIHPDGNKEGTLGCIGLSGNAATLTNFKNLLNGVLKGQISIPTTISITNNPNNDGRSNKKLPRVNE